MPVSSTYRAVPVHTSLGPQFFDAVDPADFPQHIVRWRNQRWAARVGLDGLSDAEWIDAFGRFKPLPGNIPRPLALTYHGHQFQTYNPNLGDGRGFLFAQVADGADGRVLDLATKGSGQTPYSRSGDGRLTLKGGVREILAAEMLEATGVDTSKAFSLIETGEQLVRNDEPSPTRSCVLVRLSHSHIRIGTFERLANLGDVDAIERLVAHCLTYYGPQVDGTTAEKAEALFTAVCHRVAATCAHWLAAGFVHGVLNSDNVNITGESFDYGPWRFIDHFDPLFTAAYFDQTGLYAFARQPVAQAWNLARLADCLAGLVEPEKLQAVQQSFTGVLQAAFRGAMLRRLGLAPRGSQEDGKFVETLLHALMGSRARFEQVMFDWYGGIASRERAQASPLAGLYNGVAFSPVLQLMEHYEPLAGLKLTSPYFARATPCTLLIEEVEALWEPIAAGDDWSAFDAKIADIELKRDAYAIGK